MRADAVSPPDPSRLLRALDLRTPLVGLYETPPYPGSVRG